MLPLYLPLVQETHWVAPLLAEIVPFKQLSQVFAPSLLIVPALHLIHFVNPCVLAYLPAGQLLHAPPATAEKVPKPHKAHAFGC
jgi:hypothetical protein